MMVSSSSEVMSSSSVISSSSAPALQDLVEFVYPTQKAHLGGAIQTKLVAKIIPDSVVGTVQKITIGGVALELQNGMWISTTDLNVAATDAQEFDVLLEMSNGDIKEGKSLVINNLGGATITQAGADGAYSVRGLAFDTDDNILYYSNPFDAQVSKYNSVTGGSDVVYQGTLSTQLSEALYWPIAVDSATNTIYTLMDSYDYSNTVGDYKYTVSLLVVNGDQKETYDDKSAEPVIVDDAEYVGTPLESTKGIAIDVNKKMRTSANIFGVAVPALYSLDFIGDNRIGRWLLGGDVFGLSSTVAVGAQGTDGELTKTKNALAFVLKPTQTGLTVIRKGVGNVLGSLALGEPALMDVSPNLMGGLTSKRLTILTGMVEPTAIIYNREGTHVYIADADRIWLMNMTDYTKVLVSSSNISGEGKKGTGPRIGSKVNAMALHPTLNYLYLAADTGGVIMVDLATGNRITIVK